MDRNQCALRRRRYHTQAVPSCYSVAALRGILNNNTGGARNRAGLMQQGTARFGANALAWESDANAIPAANKRSMLTRELLPKYLYLTQRTTTPVENALRFFENMALEKVRRMRVARNITQARALVVQDSVSKVIWGNPDRGQLFVHVLRGAQKGTTYCATLNANDNNNLVNPLGQQNGFRPVVVVERVPLGVSNKEKAEKLVKALLRRVWKIPAVPAASFGVFRTDNDDDEQAQAAQQAALLRVVIRAQRRFQEAAAARALRITRAMRHLQRAVHRNRAVTEIQRKFRERRELFWKRHFRKVVRKPPTNWKNQTNCDHPKTLKRLFEQAGAGRHVGVGIHGDVRVVKLRNLNNHKESGLRMPFMVVKKMKDADKMQREYEDHAFLWNRVIDDRLTRDSLVTFRPTWLTKPVRIEACGPRDYYMGSELVFPVKNYDNQKPLTLHAYIKAHSPSQERYGESIPHDERQLLKNTLIKIATFMTHLKVYHYDMHSSNIMYDNSVPGHLRLIDISLGGIDSDHRHVGWNSSEWLRLVLKHGYVHTAKHYARLRQGNTRYQVFRAIHTLAAVFRPPIGREELEAYGNFEYRR